MIQVQFTDEGKLHTVTFSGEDAKEWAHKFTNMLNRQQLKWDYKIISII